MPTGCARPRSIAAAARSLAERLDGEGLSDPASLRARLVPELRSILDEGRAEAEAAAPARGRRARLRAPALRPHGRVVARSHDAVVRHLYPADNPSSAETLAVVATGGYGRGTLAPGSDVDLLFLLPYKQTAWGESVVEAMLYVLWDLKLKVGHATRSVDECIREADGGHDDPHRAAGGAVPVRRRGALRRARGALRPARSCAAAAPEFVDAKLEERDARVAKAGASRYLVEPNVKDGKGGLRDLNTLFWIAKYVYRVREPEELVEAGLFTQEEFAAVRSAARNSCGACAATCTSSTGRAEERLTFDAAAPDRRAHRLCRRAAACPASSAS